MNGTEAHFGVFSWTHFYCIFFLLQITFMMITNHLKTVAWNLIRFFSVNIFKIFDIIMSVVLAHRSKVQRIEENIEWREEVFLCCKPGGWQITREDWRRNSDHNRPLFVICFYFPWRWIRSLLTLEPGICFTKGRSLAVDLSFSFYPAQAAVFLTGGSVALQTDACWWTSPRLASWVVLY